MKLQINFALEYFFMNSFYETLKKTEQGGSSYSFQYIKKMEEFSVKIIPMEKKIPWDKTAIFYVN